MPVLPCAELKSPNGREKGRLAQFDTRQLAQTESSLSLKVIVPPTVQKFHIQFFLMSFMKNDISLPITEDIFPGRYAVEHVAFTT